MQIELMDCAVLRCAEAVLQGTGQQAAENLCGIGSFDLGFVDVEYVTSSSNEYFVSADGLSGQSPNQEAKCASVFHRFMSSPTSLMTV
jgi:hypothetical protein